MHTTLKWMGGLLVAGSLLTGCGGSPKDEVTAPVAAPVVPDEASASPEAFTAWARTLAPSDDTEPLGMGNLTEAPTSDTLEPVALQ